MQTGLFFSFDGLDGSGKSTQIERFTAWLGERGHDVLTCRDPGGTPLSESIRSDSAFDRDSARIDSTAEMLLYMAARAQLVDEVHRALPWPPAARS